MEARSLQIVDRGLQQHRVSCHGEIADRRFAREAPDQRGQITPQEGLAAGQSHFLDAEVQELIDQPIDLFKIKDVFAR
jgi:hypothetical protein